MTGRLDREQARTVLTSRLPDDPKWVVWVDGVLDQLEGCVAEGSRIARIRALCDEQDVGWFEFLVDAATTHIAYVYEDGSVYLPEGREVVDLDDFRLATAMGKVHRLVRADEVLAILDGDAS